MPKSGDVTRGETDSYDRGRGVVDKCFGLDRPGAVSIFLFDDPAKSRREVEAYGQQVTRAHDAEPNRPSPTAGAYPDLGDVALVVQKNQTPPGNEDSPVLYQLWLSRGCWMVLVNAGGLLTNYVQKGGEADWEARRQWARQTAAAVDAKIQSGPQCPSSTTLPPPTRPSPSDLGVTLSCQHNFADPQLAVCTATPFGQKPNAQLEYAWTFDGALQTTTGAELQLTTVVQGKHTVVVIANDAANAIGSAPETVTFEQGSSSLSFPSGRRPTPPWIPFAIGTAAIGALGAVGWALTRNRARSPLPAGPLGAPMPPSSLSPPRPTTPPERAPRPAAAPPSVPRPAVPPERAMPSAAAPPVTPQPSNERQTPEKIWLEADRATVEVHGNGEDGVPVRVVAKKLKNGVTVDATNEVRTSFAVTEAKKISVRAQGGGLVVTAKHVGNIALRGRVTISGMSAQGAVTPVTIDVVVTPVRVELILRVAKRGFLDQELITTLPALPARVEGKVLGPDSPPHAQPAGRGAVFVDALRGNLRGGAVQHAGEERVVANARCEAKLRVDGQETGRFTFYRSTVRGTFGFRMPARMLAAYGADVQSYSLPTDVELALDADVNRALYYYDLTSDDLRREIAALPPEAPMAHTQKLCAVYPEEVLKMLREREESDFDRIISALQRLRAALAFALKYRRDMRAQRQLVERAAFEGFGSFLDVFTDFIPVATWLQKWFAGEEIRLVFGKRFVTLLPLNEIVRIVGEKADRYLVTRLLGKGLLASLQMVRPLISFAETLVAGLISFAASMAARAGLPPRYIDNIARWSLGGPDVQGPLSEAGAGVQAVHLAGSFLRRTVEVAIRGLACAGHVVLLGVSASWLFVGKALKAMDWGPAVGGAEETFGEIIEKYLGDTANDFYAAAGAKLDQYLGPVLPADEKRAKKDATSLVLDCVASLEDFDRKTSAALEDAWQRSMDLDVYEDWQGAISRVTKQETEDLRKWQSVDGAQWYMETAAAFLKLFAKFVQAVLFVWAALGAGVIGIPVLLLKLGRNVVQDPVWKPSDALDLAASVEKACDVLDFVMVRVPVLVKETVALSCIYNLGSVRIRKLYPAP